LAVWNLETSDEAMDDERRAALIALDRELIPQENVGLFLQFRSVWARRSFKSEEQMNMEV